MLTDALSLAIRHTAAHRPPPALSPADHDLIPPDAQLPDVILHIDQRRIAVLGRGRIGALNRQPITGETTTAPNFLTRSTARDA